MSNEVKQFKSYIRNATYSDCLELAPNLRSEDKDEVWESNNALPEEALIASLKASDRAYVVVLNDEIVCMYGVAKTGYKDLGIPWMLGTNKLKRVPKEFLERTREIIADFSGEYEVLANYVWSRNIVHIRWLEWLGFTIVLTPVNLGRNQETFYYFYKNQKE